ncbi:MAG: FHA domain-containing protein [Gammaproteobacteria bacterium]
MSGSSGERQLVSALKDTITKLRSQISDQKQRIEALARGREEGMSAVTRLRDELALVSAERDRLRQQLTALESMQTETLAYDDFTGSVGDTGVHNESPPSIDELLSGLSGKNPKPRASHSTVKVDSGSAAAADGYQEMISPELLVLGSSSERRGAVSERCLLLLEAGNQTKCPLNDDLLTIGRSESADIKIDGDFISRIHARVLRIGMDTIIEDAGSMNGTWVNDHKVERHVLKHGEMVRIGSAHFRFVDTATSEGSE